MNIKLQVKINLIIIMKKIRSDAEMFLKKVFSMRYNFDAAALSRYQTRFSILPIG